MERTSISLHFGRGEPPSNDLRDYMSEDDRWVLGGWVTDDPSFDEHWVSTGWLVSDPWKPVLPGWRDHIGRNAIAYNFLETLFSRANDSRNSAWWRYYGDDQGRDEENQGPRLGLLLSTRGIKSRNSSSQRGAGVSLRIAFGASRTLGKVNKNLLISALYFSLTPVSTADRNRLGDQVVAKLGGKEYTQPENRIDLVPGTGSSLGIFLSNSFPAIRAVISKAEFAAPPPTLATDRLEGRLHLLYGRLKNPMEVLATIHMEAPDGTYQWESRPLTAGGNLRPGIINVGIDVPVLVPLFDRCAEEPALYSSFDYRFFVSMAVSKVGDYCIVDFSGPHNPMCVMGTISTVSIETPAVGPSDQTEALLLRFAHFSQMFSPPRGIAFTYVHRVADYPYPDSKVSDIRVAIDPFDLKNLSVDEAVVVSIFGECRFGNGNSLTLDFLSVVPPGERKNISFSDEFEDILLNDHGVVLEADMSLTIRSEKDVRYCQKKLELRIK